MRLEKRSWDWVTPAHGFAAPWLALRLALGMPRNNRTHAMIVATRAGAKISPVFTPGFEGTAVFPIALTYRPHSCSERLRCPRPVSRLGSIGG